jgi:hypothetical protein
MSINKYQQKVLLDWSGKGKKSYVHELIQGLQGKSSSVKMFMQHVVSAEE